MAGGVQARQEVVSDIKKIGADIANLTFQNEGAGDAVIKELEEVIRKVTWVSEDES